MAHVAFKGSPVMTAGDLPAVGEMAPAFTLTGKDLADIPLKDFAGKTVVLNIFPSIDTPVCAASVRRFNAEAAALGDTVVLCVSADLPFAAGRFCSTEGIDNVVTLSMMRSRSFAKDYGVLITDGPLAGIAARSVVVLDANDRVVYTELVPEILQEPDYEKAIAAC